MIAQDQSEMQVISVRGACEGPLRSVDVDLPIGRLLCVVGRSGSGHRALLERVLYAESRARYMRALTPFEREGQVGIFKVKVDSISGLPPAINYLRWDVVPAGTLGSYVSLDGPLARFFLTVGQVHCPACGAVCRSYKADEVESEILLRAGDGLVTVLAPLSLAGGSDGQLLLAELRRSGYVRVRIDGEIFRLDNQLPELGASPIEVVVDRLRAGGEDSRRFIEAVRTARAISRGQTWIVDEEGGVAAYNQQLTCSQCALQYEELSAEDLLEPGEVEWGKCVQWGGRSFVDILIMPIIQLRDLLAETQRDEISSLRKVLDELCEMDLGNLTLALKLSTLSTGEWQRLRLGACVGSGLSGILYLFAGVVSAVDPLQRAGVVTALKRLVAAGNTLVIMDAAPELLKSADAVWECEEGTIKSIGPEVLIHGVEGRVVRSSQEEWGLRGSGSWGEVDLQVPKGAMIGLTGKSGGGKTQFLRDLVLPVLKGNRKDYHAQWLQGRIRVHFPVRILRERTLLQEVGLVSRVAELFAQTPAGMDRSYPAEFFSVEKPGGRCPACEGRGCVRYDLQFAEDMELLCPACEGRRFRSEVLEITYRGANIAEVLEMEAVHAQSHFTRERIIAERLSPFASCGVGHVRLGQAVSQLEWGEGLRLQLAMIRSKVSARDFVLLDHPTLGEHPAEVRLLMDVLIALLEGGATILVADHHPDIVASCSILLNIDKGQRVEGVGRPRV
jgi:excinuclease ABC subunit A